MQRTAWIGFTVFGAILLWGLQKNSQRRNAAWEFCSFTKSSEIARLSGMLEVDPSGFSQLRSPRWLRQSAEALGEHRQDLAGIVRLHLPRAERFSGESVLIEGWIQCAWPRRLPGDYFSEVPQARMKVLRVWRGKRFAISLQSGQRWLQNQFVERVGRYPITLGFTSAVWTGSTGWLDERWGALGKYLGVLHLLALSGQHVWIFCSLLQATLGVALRFGLKVYPFFPRKNWVARGYLLLAEAGAVTLFLVTSGFSASMIRTAAFVLFRRILKIRGLRTSAPQTVTSAAAALILFFPELASSKGFLLSFFASFILAVDLSAGNFHRGYQNFLWLSLTLPLQLFVLGSFLFHHANLYTPFWNVVFCLLWVVWLPIFFLLPVLLFFPDAVLHFLMSRLEWVLEKIQFSALKWGESAQDFYLVTVCPTLLELMALEALLVTGTYYIKRRLVAWQQDSAECVAFGAKRPQNKKIEFTFKDKNVR